MKKLIYLIPFLLIAAGCQKESLESPETPAPPMEEAIEHPLLQGHIRIKFKEEAVRKLQVVKTKSGISTGLSALDLTGINLGAYHMEPVFKVGGRFEARQRKAGLHLWYDVYFDEKVPTRSAAQEYQELPEIEYVETIPEARSMGAVEIPSYMEPMIALSLIASRAGAEEEEEMPFNDSRLKEQWHYNNGGETNTWNHLAGAIKGADIDLFKAWKIETGSPNVIVAVMDGGIQYNHPDLNGNMWVNELELNGTPGSDDDNNGYIDDIYGVNFVTRTQDNANSPWKNCTITQHSHGTHCAGTIAAVNNNSTGVCGIAGGSGSNDGVRLMSCQIFHSKADGTDQANAAPDMYRYAADNGAVISQNSWTNGRMSDNAFLNSALRTAIDYFIANAGTDENGNQTGPMKGGMVIFATANQNSDIKEYPVAYERNLRVAAMGPDFKKATYSNYGTWADITAPGGEQSKGDVYAILSTNINDGYAWMQGTSMACPHVSGCAALVLSKFQGQGYTPQDLRERLLNTVGNIDQYNPKYAGKMGAGYVRVGEALTPPSTEAPVSPELKLVDSYDDWAIIEWTVGEAADGPLSRYELYWGTTPFEGSTNLTANEMEIPEDAIKQIYDVKFLPKGSLIRDTLKGLKLNTHYYYTLRAVDRWGQSSSFSEQQDRIVLKNQAPEVTAKWSGSVLLDEGSMRVLSLKCIEPEQQAVNIRLEPEIKWVTPSLNNQELNLSIQAGYGIAGTYNTTLIITDQYGAETRQEISFEVVHKNSAPQLTRIIPEQNLEADGTTKEILLDDYFQDLAGRKLLYELNLEGHNSGIAFVQRRDNKLLITPQQTGSTQISVIAENPDGMKASCGVSIQVKKAGAPWTVIQQGSHLQIGLSEKLQGNIILRLYNVAGREVKTYSADIGPEGFTLDISSLSAGAYVMVLEAKGEKLTRNIIKR